MHWHREATSSIWRTARSLPALLVGVGILLAIGPVLAEGQLISITDLEDVRLLAVSSSEETVILHVPGEGLQLIHKNERFLDGQVTLLSATSSRLVVEMDVMAHGRVERSSIYLEPERSGKGRLVHRRMSLALPAREQTRSILPLTRSSAIGPDRVQRTANPEPEGPEE